MISTVNDWQAFSLSNQEEVFQDAYEYLSEELIHQEAGKKGLCLAREKYVDPYTRHARQAYAQFCDSIRAPIILPGDKAALRLGLAAKFLQRTT